MKLLCTHCLSTDHSITSCPKLKISHGTPRLDPTITAAQQLHHDRLDLVRHYLAHPAGWPDGLDLPNWKQPHELWYTGHESYWNNLATKRRKPMMPDATKPPHDDATKPPHATKPVPVAPQVSVAKEVTKNKGGRPRAGEKPLSSTERSRLARIRKKSQKKLI
jgi:hypothetical protein